MSESEMRDEEAGLLALLSVCGVETPDAPDVLRDYLKGAARRRRGESSDRRAALFQGLVAHVRSRLVQPRLATSPQHSGLLPVRRLAERSLPLFERTPWDIRAGLFLITALEFSLRDAAGILKVEPAELAARLDRMLSRLEDARQTASASRRR